MAPMVIFKALNPQQKSQSLDYSDVCVVAIRKKLDTEFVPFLQIADKELL